MIILGIDPGTAITGYGVIEVNQVNQEVIRLIKHGSIKTSKSLDSPQRLNLIYRQILQIIQEHKPQILVLESLFFNTNAKSASAVGQAMGVIKLAAARKKIEVVEYPPLKIKMVLTENGRAKKNQIQSRVRKFLGLRKLPRPTHAADALAAAICHWKTRNDKIKKRR